MCRGGELFDKIAENDFFSESIAAKIFQQVLESLAYCHSMGIAHRDLKPENFLFEEDNLQSDLKMIDFGLSKVVSKRSNKEKMEDTLAVPKEKKKMGKVCPMQTRAGTPYYISPEVLSGNYGVECDLWSAGCILYILLCGYPPFNGEDD